LSFNSLHADNADRKTHEDAHTHTPKSTQTHLPSATQLVAMSKAARHTIEDTMVCVWYGMVWCGMVCVCYGIVCYDIV